MASSFEQQIRVTADISPAEKAVGKLTNQFARLQKAAQFVLKPARFQLDTTEATRRLQALQRATQSTLKPARFQLDTSRANRQLRELKQQINGIASTQTVRVRVIREVEDRALGSASSPGGTAGMALLGAAASTGLAAGMQRRALPPAGSTGAPGNTSTQPDAKVAALLKRTEAEIQLLGKAAVLTKEQLATLAELNRDRQVLLRQVGGAGGGGRIPPGGGGLLPPAGGLPPRATPATPAASAKGATYARDAKAASGLASTLGKLATAYFSVQAAAIAYQRIAAPALERDSALRAIRANTEQFGEYGQAMTAVRSQVQKLGISQTEAAQGFVAAYNALRPLGIQLETINQIQTAFIASSRLSGASAETAAAGWRQLVQALGRGQLSGDELVSVLENAPAVAQAIAKELGVSVGKLKELGEEGSLTADKIVAALLKLRDPALSKLDVVLQGPAQQLKNLSNLMQDLAVELGRVFGPALGSELKSISTAVQGLVGWMKTLTPEFGKTVVEAVKLVAQLFLVSKAIKAVQATSAVVGYLRTLAATQVTVGTTAGSATLATNALAASLARLAAFGAITLAIKVAIDGLVELQRLNGEVDKLQGKNAKGAAAAFTGASAETVTRAQSVQRGLLVGYRSKLADFERQRDQTQALNPGVALLMEKNAKVLRERIKFAEAVLKLDASDYKSQAELNRLKEEQRQKEIKALQQGVPVPDADDKKEEVRRGVIGGYTGGGQAGPSRGRSTGPHLHAQLVRGNNLESLVDAALDFGGGRTASSFGLGRGAAAHGYPGRDFYTPQGTPFTLRAGWQAQDLGIQGALGRGMRISGPGGVFELGHLQGVQTGDLNGKGAAGDLLDAQQDALNAAIEFQQKQEEQLATSKQLLAVAQQDLLISQTRDPLKRAELEGEKAQLEIKQKYAELQTNALSAEELLNLQLAEKAELERASNEALKTYVERLYEALGAAELLSTEVEKFGPKAFGGSPGGAGGADGYAPGMPNLNPGSGNGGKERLQGEYDRIQQELKKLQDPVYQIVEGANAIGEAFGTAFKDVATGAKSAQQALADAFQGIANHFLDMASQMIAQYITMQIIGLASSFLGGSATGAAGSKGYTLPKGGGYAQGFSMPSIMGRASGGPINAGQPYLVGEQGPELVVPNQSGTVLNTQNTKTAARAALKGGEGGAGGGTTFNWTFTSSNFGGKEFVERDQLEAALALTRREAAAMGERRTLDRLRQSPKTRRSLGM